jgi:hypothetical protein
MSFTPDSERLVVKFLSSALGQGRETARAFCQRLPENVQPRLLAVAQNWNQRSCLDASSQFSSLMGTNVSPVAPVVMQPAPARTSKLTPVAPAKTRKKVVWTAEMRAAQSKKVKRLMAAKKRARLAAQAQTQETSAPQPVAVAADATRF